MDEAERLIAQVRDTIEGLRGLRADLVEFLVDMQSDAIERGVEDADV